MTRVLIVVSIILTALVIVLSVKLVIAIDDKKAAETDKSYLEMKITDAVKTLENVRHRRLMEDSLRAINSKNQYEENIRLIRDASDADIKRIILQSTDSGYVFHP